jgi:hypothetical protein
VLVGQVGRRFANLVIFGKEPLPTLREGRTPPHEHDDVVAPRTPPRFCLPARTKEGPPFRARLVSVEHTVGSCSVKERIFFADLREEGAFLWKTIRELTLNQPAAGSWACTASNLLSVLPLSPAPSSPSAQREKPPTEPPLLLLTAENNNNESIMSDFNALMTSAQSLSLSETGLTELQSTLEANAELLATDIAAAVAALESGALTPDAHSLTWWGGAVLVLRTSC